MAQLLMPPAQRQTTFHRGSHKIDEATRGYTDEGSFLMDTTQPANSNSGHDYGTKLSPDEKKELIEYLKTL